MGHGQAPTNATLSLSESCRTGAFRSIHQFVDHPLSLEQKRQDDLAASVHLPVTSTPLLSSRSPPVTPSFSSVIAPTAGLSPVVEVVGGPLKRRNVPVLARQLQIGPQICDDYPGCPSRSDSSDEMSELDDSEARWTTSAKMVVGYSSWRREPSISCWCPKTRTKSHQAVNMDVFFAGT